MDGDVAWGSVQETCLTLVPGGFGDVVWMAADEVECSKCYERLGGFSQPWAKPRLSSGQPSSALLRDCEWSGAIPRGIT